MTPIEINRFITAVLAVVDIALLVYLVIKRPAWRGYAVAPAIYLFGLVAYFVYLFLHLPLSVAEAEIINLWSSTLRLYGLLAFSFIGFWIVLQCKSKSGKPL